MVGHVEWIEFAAVDAMPAAGDIVHAGEVWEEPGGGGAVAAVQLAKLAGGADFYTALGDDELGHRAKRALEDLGLTVHATFRPEPQRRGFVHVDERGERTITVIGDRLGPRAGDPLPWGELRHADAVYLTAGDPGAVRLARAAGVLVSTARGLEAIAESRVELDALVASGADRGELYERGRLDPSPRVVIRTAGAAGGEWETATETGAWNAVPLGGPVRDAYGCGDSFAAGVTYGLGAGMGLEEALELGARCGAACLTGRGPFSGQLQQA